jgi:hypothetical protein
MLSKLLQESDFINTKHKQPGFQVLYVVVCTENAERIKVSMQMDVRRV